MLAAHFVKVGLYSWADLVGNLILQLAHVGSELTARRLETA
jgi:hypothetical protein